MIDSISSDSTLLTTVSSHYEMTAGRTSETARTEKDAAKKAPADEIKATHGSYDTVTISAAGSAYAQQAAAAKASQEGAGVTTAKTGGEAVSSAAKASTDTAVKAAASMKLQEDAGTDTDMETETDAAALSEEASETENLADYTDAELRQMMYKGDITQSEYDEEMLSRNGFAAETEE